MPGSCQRPDVLALRILVRPVKMNPGPVMDHPLWPEAASCAFPAGELYGTDVSTACLGLRMLSLGATVIFLRPSTAGGMRLTPRLLPPGLSAAASRPPLQISR